MTQKKIIKRKANPSPSDGLFKKIMENEVAAREFLEHYLPQDFKQLIDLSKIKVEKESYVEENLKRASSDIVYSVATREGEEAFIYVLIEAQSTCDYWIGFRLWKYMLLLCERHKNKGNKKGNKNKLPLVAPLVFYHGSKAYNAPLNLWELFTIPAMAKQLMSDNYRLVDLHSMSDDDLKKKEHLGMLEYFMKNIHQRDLLKVWEQFLKQFDRAILIDQERGYIYIKQFLWYTESKVAEEKQQELGRLIKQHLDREQGENVMRTIAQKYIEEGEAKGEARGTANLIKLMISKGTDLKDIVRQTGLSITEIKKMIS